MTRGPGRRFRRNKCDDLLLVRLPQHGLVCCETECDLDSLPPVAACACYRHVPRTARPRLVANSWSPSMELHEHRRSGPISGHLLSNRIV